MKTDKQIMKEFVDMVNKWQDSQRLCDALLSNAKERTAKELLLDLLVSSEFQALKQRAESGELNEYNSLDELKEKLGGKKETLIEYIYDTRDARPQDMELWELVEIISDYLDER